MPDSYPNPTQLNGWKEIGAFFGKSPRTVQRWEAKLGLPVKRIKTPAGEILYALRHELEAWREDATARRAAVGSEWDSEESGPDEENDGEPSAPPDPRALPVGAVRAGQPAHSRRVVVVSVIAVVAMAVAVAVSTWPRRPSGSVASAEFSGNALVARDSAGREQWRYLFAQGLWVAPDPAAWNFKFVPGAAPIVADITRDGRPEVLAVATYGPPGSVSAPQELLCFSPSGEVLWTYRPQLALAFASERFESHWQVLDLLVAEAPAEPGVWLSVVSAPWWAGAVVRIDTQGKPEVRYTSSGAIYALAQIVGPSGWRLLAGGVNNEYAAAAVAVLDESGPAATSPQTEGSRYQCRSCPAGSPQMYFLLPRTDINIAEGERPYNEVCDIRRMPGGLDILTLESRQHSAFGFYRMLPSLEIERFVMSDSTAHRRLEVAGRIDHKEADCPLAVRGPTIRQWTPDRGWQDRVVSPARSADAR